MELLDEIVAIKQCQLSLRIAPAYSSWEGVVCASTQLNRFVMLRHCKKRSNGGRVLKEKISLTDCWWNQ